MATPNTQHPDRQSSQPQMPGKEGEKRNANTSSSPDPREAQRGRDVQEPRKRDDDIERYASDDEDLDTRDVTDEFDDSSNDSSNVTRNASSSESSSQDKSLKGQQRSSSSSERGTASSERSSSRNEDISSERSTDRSSSSERKSSDKRH